LSTVTSVYLHPGQLFASTEPTVITTILGSCVGVCLWDPVLKAGALNHFLLPYGKGEGAAALRFGNLSMENLIRKMDLMGCSRENIQAKIFGGGCVIQAFRDEGQHLGLKNIEIAKKVLKEEKIRIAGEDVGGRNGRKLIFHTEDGTVWVKLL